MSQRMIGISIIIGILVGIIANPLQAAEKVEAQEPVKSSKEADEVATVQTETVSVWGRLVLKSEKDRSQLVLYGKNAKVYVIYGEYRGLLESIVSDLGENNLLSVTGTLNGGYDILCHKKQVPGKSGNLIQSTECIRQYYLYVTRVNDAIKSAEEMPKPERNAEEEKIAEKRWAKDQSLTQFASVRGKITSLNLRSPVKLMKITFRDKDNNPINKSLFLNLRTRIAKKVDKEPMELTMSALKEGQMVMVEYSTTIDGKNTAVAITITKE